jgi:hypothetical protein
MKVWRGGPIETVDLYRFSQCPLRYLLLPPLHEGSIAAAKDLIRWRGGFDLTEPPPSIRESVIAWDTIKRRHRPKTEGFSTKSDWTRLYISTKNFVDKIIEEADGYYPASILETGIRNQVIRSYSDLVTFSPKGGCTLWMASSLTTLEFRRSMIPFYEYILLERALRSGVIQGMGKPPVIKKISLTKGGRIETLTLPLSTASKRVLLDKGEAVLENLVSFLRGRPLLSIPNKDCKDCEIRCQNRV